MMIDETLAQFGFAAVMSGALLWVIVKMHKDNATERKHWYDKRDQADDKNRQTHERLAESMDGLKDAIRDRHQ